jgi:hypothetical protein
MNKIQAIEKIKSLLPDLQEYLLERCNQLIASGGIDLESFNDDFQAPKIILTAATADAVEGCYMPRDCHLRRLVSRLRHF